MSFYIRSTRLDRLLTSIGRPVKMIHRSILVYSSERVLYKLRKYAKRECVSWQYLKSSLYYGVSNSSKFTKINIHIDNASAVILTGHRGNLKEEDST